MTGAGSAHIEGDSGRVEVDARAVNHRFLKASVRVHGPLAGADARIEARIRERFARGHISVTVRFTPPAAESVRGRIDGAAFDAAASHLRALAEASHVAPPTVGDVLRVPGVVQDARSGRIDETTWPLLSEALDMALDALMRARESEGARLRDEMLRLLDAVSAAASTMDARAAEIPHLLRQRLETRLAELLAGSTTKFTDGQLEREVALLAEKGDIREEIARLEAHVAHAREQLEAGGALGRSLDFLVQELHRETNTVASKSTDLALSRAAMELKANIERLREQVQNIE